MQIMISNVTKSCVKICSSARSSEGLTGSGPGICVTQDVYYILKFGYDRYDRCGLTTFSRSCWHTGDYEQ